VGDEIREINGISVANQSIDSHSTLFLATLHVGDEIREINGIRVANQPIEF
jgi:hypothetical protein